LFFCAVAVKVNKAKTETNKIRTAMVEWCLIGLE